MVCVTIEFLHHLSSYNLFFNVLYNFLCNLFPFLTFQNTFSHDALNVSKSSKLAPGKEQQLLEL